MPISKSNFLRISAAMLVIGLLSLLGIVGTTWWLVERTQNYFEEVVEAREARRATVTLRNSLQEMETSQRGFLLTADESYLELFDAARQRVEPEYQALSAILAPFPQAEAPMQRLREAIDLKLGEMERTIELRQADALSEALEIVRTDRGQELMQEARTFFDSLLAAADRRLSEGVEEQRSAANWLRLAAILGGLVILAVVSACVWVALAYTRELIAAREEVEELNAELESRVDERTQELLRANEEIQRFAYIVTHDLRAPLVNIMGFTSELDETMKSIQKYVLADGDPVAEHDIKDAREAAATDLPEAIGFIRSSTRKMDALINAILKISRDGRRPLKPERLDLRELLAGTAETVQHQVAESEGEVTIEGDLPPIFSDRMSLDQIFGNLLDNAIKYRAPERPIEVRISVRKLPGRRVAVDVADNGRGIAPKDHQRVFDLFRRSGAQDQPGEGIGLAHVRTLVRNLGGDIVVESELGQGTTFTVTLPDDVRSVLRSASS